MELELVGLYGERTIPAAVRKAVIARDGMVCGRCGVSVVRQRRGASYRPDAMHLDHVIPWASGGPSTVENLVVSCAACNLSRPRPEVIRQSKVRVELRRDGYWWPAGFTPPRVTAADDRYLRPIPELAKLVASTEVSILNLILAGELAASEDSPIVVEVPDFVREHMDRQREESRQRTLEGMRVAAQERAARRRSERPTRRPWRTKVRATPEEAARWQAMKDERRARERAAKALP